MDKLEKSQSRRTKVDDTLMIERQKLAAAKLNLLDSSAQIDPLKTIRNHPWMSVSGAAAIGAVAAHSPSVSAVRILSTAVAPALGHLTRLVSLVAMQIGQHLVSQSASSTNNSAK